MLAQWRDSQMRGDQLLPRLSFAPGSLIDRLREGFPWLRLRSRGQSRAIYLQRAPRKTAGDLTSDCARNSHKVEREGRWTYVLSLSLFSDLAPLPAGSGPCKPDRGNLAFGINARTRAGGRRLSAAAAVLPPRSFPTSPRSKSRFWITNQASRFPSTRFSVSPSSRSKFRD